MGNETPDILQDVPIREQMGDVRWVYEHYADEEISEGDAPSRGAWGLLQACRNDANTYRQVLERIHPKDQGVDGEESAGALLELDARVRQEWGQLAGVLETACRQPEFVEPLAEFTRQWKAANPRKITPAQAEALRRRESNVMEPDEVPA